MRQGQTSGMGYQPTREVLSQQLGCPVPEALATIVRIAHEVSGGNEEVFAAQYHNPGPLALAGDAARYPRTPPEMFPIASTNVGGEHWGYVVYRPDQTDYPVGTYCPMDPDGVLALGRDTRDAWSRLLVDDRADEIPEVFALRVRSALTLTEDVPMPLEEQLKPDCPQGWRFVATLDGVGVLAPGTAFDDGLHSPDIESTTSVVAAARNALTSGKPASALKRIKDSWWEHSEPEDILIIYADTWIDCLEAIGLSVVADSVRRSKKRAQDTADERAKWKRERDALLAEPMKDRRSQ